MKKRIFIICAVIIAIGFTTFGCNNKTKNSKVPNEEQPTVVAIDQRTGKIDFYGNNPDTLQANKGFFYLVRGKHVNTITLKGLKEAQSISDVIPNYPSSWIAEYISVEIIVNINGKEIKAKSKNDVINNAQKELFASFATISDVVIHAKYRSENSVKNKLDDREMNYLMTVIPEVQAEFIGGYDKMITYLQDKSANKIDKINYEKLSQGSIFFTINEIGAIEDVQLTETTGYTEIDNLLFDVIKEMPNWKPAENSENKAIKQEFLFNFGLDGC